MGFLPWLTARLSCPLLPRLAWRGGCRLLALLGCLLSAASTARAHPLDEANLYHFFSCDLAADSLTVDYRLLVGGLAVFKLWDRMDTDRNKVLSEAEKTTFTAKMHGTVTATLDGKPLPLTLDSYTLPGYEDFIAGTAPYLQFIFKAGFKDLPPGPHTLVLTTRAFSDLTNVYIRATVNAPEALAAKNLSKTNQKGFTLRFTTPGASGDMLPDTAEVPVQTVPTNTTPPAKHGTGTPAPMPARGGPRTLTVATEPMIWMEATLLSALRTAWKRQQAQEAALREEERQGKGNREQGKEGKRSQRQAAIENRRREERGLEIRHPESGAPASTPAAAPPVAPSAPLPSRTLRTLRPFLLGQGGLLLALGLAVLLGAAHALLPGHSKAVVGAYLVGAGGTVGDAIFLGGVVTLAHTGIVLLFGVLMWNLERFAPERIQPWLQAASGVLIALLGLGLLLRGLLRPQEADDRAGRENALEGPGGKSAATFAYVPRPGAGQRRHNRGRLLSLGLAGGMVPCGDALILLLFAHAQHKTTFGLVLVTAFGLGMAVVLMGVGIATVKAGSVLSRFCGARFERIWRAAPIVSALLILALGLWLTKEALAAGPLP